MDFVFGIIGLVLVIYYVNKMEKAIDKISLIDIKINKLDEMIKHIISNEQGKWNKNAQKELEKELSKIKPN